MFRGGCSKINFYQSFIKGIWTRPTWDPASQIALDPISGTPTEIVKVPLTLGRLLRSSKRVTRGIGSIRQDVNISVNGGKVVEVKDKQLSQLIKVLDYETKRQYRIN